MVHSIGNACSGLLLADGEGIDGVENRHGREQQRVHITNLVVGLGARDHTSAVVFRAGSCEGDDVDDRQGGLCFHLIGDQIPGVAVVLSSGCDSL